MEHSPACRPPAWIMDSESVHAGIPERTIVFDQKALGHGYPKWRHDKIPAKKICDAQIRWLLNRPDVLRDSVE